MKILMTNLLTLGFIKLLLWKLKKKETFNLGSSYFPSYYIQTL